MKLALNPKMIRIVSLAAQALVGLVAVAIATILIGPRIAGWDVVTVLSGSMAPTYPTDSVLAVESIDPSKIEEGDVIAFKPEADQTLVSHRVTAVIETPAGLSFTTKGDANEDPDHDPVLAKDVHGRVVFGVPVLGKLIRIAHTPMGFLMLLVVPALFVILHEARSIRRTLREDREGTTDSSAHEPIEPVTQPVGVEPVVVGVAPAGVPSRQLLLITVAANWANRREILELATLSGGALVAIGHSSVALSIAAEPSEVAAFERLLGRFTVLSVERSRVLTVSMPEHEAASPGRVEPTQTSDTDLSDEFDRIIAEGLQGSDATVPGAGGS